ncbi:phenylacetate-CoA oxygenase subunit PaaI [Niastella koreensis]|uniref:Phenylacetate-CoA oxygenase, PaaI subunit n=2 Tax=Niastella koreensis TaxID=354356 RepID=G8TA58_NIAKG|nr:1,2-phenylacetyl-CoA epoxidase subunit PaaC [Niastella koreensis]AEW02430.1 phenylacetate-CoA oxygenase, PaaI subunit [Niastella koreensis GR20-10]OQP54805.1 phenylacetate-CoA oxygenase subunit PaaI [Niastella koreensis]
MTKDKLYNYTLHLADNALMLAQRNSEWCGHGPVLEQDIAITNISLDLIGQARSLYQYVAELVNNAATSTPPAGGGGREGAKEATEDSLAYLRDVREYKNCLLVEQPNGDWAQTILRQFFFSLYQYGLYQQLLQSTDATLAAIAEKSLKEVTYHVRWSSEWVIRLGDGTEESHNRLENALEELWTFTGELFTPASYELEAVKAGFGVDVSALKPEWEQKVNEIFSEATLSSPPAGGGGREGAVWMQAGGKEGIHTEQLGYILAELQYMQRAYPEAEW